MRIADKQEGILSRSQVLAFLLSAHLSAEERAYLAREKYFSAITFRISLLAGALTPRDFVRRSWQNYSRVRKQRRYENTNFKKDESKRHSALPANSGKSVVRCDFYFNIDINSRSELTNECDKSIIDLPDRKERSKTCRQVSTSSSLIYDQQHVV